MREQRLLVKLGKYLKNVYRVGLKSIIIKNGLIVVNLDREELVSFLSFLKSNTLLKFESLLDIWGVDYPDRQKGFEVNYLLLSLGYNLRIIVKLCVSEEERVDSLTSIFNSSGWLEREVWDMYGVYFKGNSDLRRILTDYGFEGHPLRKDFPLSGYVEVGYDDGEKRVLVEPLELAQEYRDFKFLSPWDEK